MTDNAPNAFGEALARLRLFVIACSWMIALSLVAQIFIWGLVTGADWHRTESPATAAATPLVVTGNQPVNPVATAGTDEEVIAGPTFIPTPIDSVYRGVAMLARAAGTMGVLVLIPVVMVCVVLVATTRCPTVDKAVSAMIWSIVIPVLCLPLAPALGLPWADGAFYAYENMRSTVESSMGAGLSGQTHFARYLLLPTACVAGTIVMAFRFSAGIEPAIVRRAWQLDPELEAEAGNIQISSLHGGRTAAAFRAAVHEKEQEVAETREEAPPANPLPLSGDIGQPSPGERPRRII